MSIPIADKTVALLVALSPEIVDSLPPVERRRLAAECRRVAALAEPRPAGATAKVGVLSRLKDGERSE